MGNSTDKFKGPGHTTGGGGGKKTDDGGGRGRPPTAQQHGMKKVVGGGGRTSLPSKMKSKQEPIDEKTLQERRDRAAQAAETREKVWEERLNKARAKRTENPTITPPPPPLQPLLPPSSTMTTEETVAKALEKERQVSNKLGFNPYAATISSSTGARTAIDLEQTTTSSSTRQQQQQQPEMDDDPEEMFKLRKQLMGLMHSPSPDPVALSITVAKAEKLGVPEVDEAKAILSSVLNEKFSFVWEAVEYLETANVDNLTKLNESRAILLKCVTNLLDKPDEPKFRKIKLENKVFNEKILQVEGAMQILELIGFERKVVDGDDVLIVPDPATLSREEFENAKQAFMVTKEALTR